MYISFFNDFAREAIATGIVLILLVLLRVITTKLVRRYARLSQTVERRTNLVIKYLHLLINILLVVALIIIWGVDAKEDFPVIAEIEDIGAFYISMINKEGELVIYPNNLLLQKGISIVKTEFPSSEFTD
jgi:uncharacterized membrane protein